MRVHRIKGRFDANLRLLNRLEQGLFKPDSTPLLRVGIRQWLVDSIQQSKSGQLSAHLDLDRHNEAIIVIQEAQLTISKWMQAVRLKYDDDQFKMPAEYLNVVLTKKMSAGELLRVLDACHTFIQHYNLKLMEDFEAIYLRMDLKNMVNYHQAQIMQQ